MNIRILNMQLLNFKGVRKLNVDFGDITNITGDNATGKTTIFDAFTWLLFGKNSEDAKDFNIKTLDKHNQPIHRLEHEVTALLDVDGRHMKFRRGYKEKWVKKRGEAEQEFTGHETEYFCDDVPLSQKEFQARVDFIMNENIAKMITSPLYFNSLKWQERRGVLEAMAGTVSHEEIAGSNTEFKKLLSLLGDTPMVDFKKKIGAKKKLLKDQLEGIPTRIDEAQRSKPEAQDWADIALRIKNKQTEIAGIETAMEEKTGAYELQFEAIRKKQQELSDLKIKLGQLKTSATSNKKNKLAELNGLIAGLEQEIKNEKAAIERNNNLIKSNQQTIDTLTKRNDTLRAEWQTENSKTLTIDDHALNCPTCKQALPEDERENIKERLTTNFNNSKKTKLADISKKGEENKAEIDRLSKLNEELTDVNQGSELTLHGLQEKLAAHREDAATVNGWVETASPEVLKLEKEIEGFVIPASPIIDNSELKNKKVALALAIDDLKKVISSKEQIEKTDARIKELEAEEEKLSQELADLERTEFTLDAFSKAKIEAVEQRTNGKFKLVKFKMFQQNINGGEEPCCECMVDGVPYSDVNTAGKINAGIDIINALTEHYGINAPVWIDNRESVIRILPCESQIINLRAVKDAKLTIEVAQQEMALAS